MKGIIRVLCVVFIAILVSGCLVGCGNDGYKPESVVIYKEFNGVAGEDDALVKAELEKMFEEDTGKKIDLIIEYASSTGIQNKATTALADAGTRIDALVQATTSTAVCTSAIIDGLAMDITDLIDEKGTHIKAAFDLSDNDDKLAWRGGFYEGKMYAVSSRVKTSGFGLLVNKDYMAKTTYNPDEYDVANENCKQLTISEFEDLLKQLQEKTDAERPLVATPWEVDRTLAPAFGTVNYDSKTTDSEGRIIEPYLTEEYKELTEFERRLQENKLWIEKPSSPTNPDQYFISGKGAVYAVWSEVTEQISMANKIKAASGFDTIMLAPITSDEGVDNGYLRVKSGFSSALVPVKSKNAELFIEFLDWLYSDAEHMDVATLGVPGVHWEAVEENGVKMWKYPDDKVDEYTLNPPYSGIYQILENVNVSDRVYSGYSEQHENWYINLTTIPSYPVDGFAGEGVIVPSIPVTDRTLVIKQRAMSDDWQAIRAFAWSDAPMGEKTIQSMWEQLVSDAYSEEGYLSVLDYISDQYKDALQTLGDLA